ncbi:MAG: GtrA family protein [Lachnospiraceae bacterium]|nr:GtrA family protein [Lachnospiraceae bacterium]
MDSEGMTKEEKKKDLIAQILKFGVVGGLSFVIDFIITLIVSYVCRLLGMDVATAATVGGLFGFCISLIFNYLMSMRFVFERRDDLDRKKEFAIFAFLSLIGLGINELILYFGVIVCDKTVPQLVTEYPSYVTAGVKMVATGVVMVYNFISRKMTLEKR